MLYLLILLSCSGSPRNRMEECIRERRYSVSFSLEDPPLQSNVILGFTRRIIGVPKPESDSILQFLFRQISENPDFQVRFKWETNDVAIWDNRVGICY